MSPQSSTAAPEFQLLHQGEIWIEESNGECTFYHTKVIYTCDSIIYYAITDRRFAAGAPVPLSELHPTATQIPAEQVRPDFPATGLTRAPLPLAKDTHLKRPSLLNHAEGDHSISALVLEEARVCEVLLKAPHPNLATYHGCYVTNDRIGGLVFSRYDRTLEERKGEPGLVVHHDEWLAGIKSGLEHFHKLGFAHNDVNPTNIMFAAGSEVPVLIDFDSARAEGGKLGIKTGSYGWSPEGGFKMSVKENDEYGVEKIAEFLEEWKRKSEKAQAKKAAAAVKE